MDRKAIFKLCKEQGCCDACAVRYLGVKHPNAYENIKQHISQYADTPTDPKASEDKTDSNTNETEETHKDNGLTATSEENGANGGPACKRRKVEACVSCLGVLEEETWPECNQMVKEVLDKKGYDSQSFACALSAPISTLLRERVLALKIQETFPDYDITTVTPLKEAWKWSYGGVLARHVGRSQDSGAVCPLLVTVTMEYQNEATELELLKLISPSVFESRSRQKRRFTVEFTRRAAELALDAPAHRVRAVAGGGQGAGGEGGLAAAVRVRCVSVHAARDPIYIGGRYVKLSRALPQTPWLAGGARVLPSSVQELLCQPLGDVLGIPSEEVESRLKFMSAGREDVDVRCLGDGRPFAVEVSDPRRTPSAAELQAACAQVSAGGTVLVRAMCVVDKEELTVLKQGEESKCKTYEALCIKLSHSEHETDKSESDAITVTEEDIQNMNAYRNTPPTHRAAVVISQRTPIRVLHRRPLLAREREIIELKADLVPGHPQLFKLRIRTSAGTYVKEWVHGELRRTRPALAAALCARADILALDVAAVHLNWPSGG